MGLAVFDLRQPFVNMFGASQFVFQGWIVSMWKQIAKEARCSLTTRQWNKRFVLFQ
jgi:hypothetical protein